MSLQIKVCKNCGVGISGHDNRKFCSDGCANIDRYKRTGMRSTTEQRSAWRRNRLKAEGYADKIRRQTNNRSRCVKTFLAAFKLAKGCADCGFCKHHVALDFDHVR